MKCVLATGSLIIAVVALLPNGGCVIAAEAAQPESGFGPTTYHDRCALTAVPSFPTMGQGGTPDWLHFQRFRVPRSGMATL